MSTLTNSTLLTPPLDLTENHFDIARETLLDPWGLKASDLDQTVESIVTPQVDYADLFFQYERSQGWYLEEGIVKSGSFDISQGVGVRAVAGEKTAFAYSEVLSPKHLSEAAQVVKSIGRQGGAQKPAAIKGSNPHQLYRAIDPITTRTDAQKVELLERVEQMARARDPRIVQVMAGLSLNYEVVLICNSEGRLVSDVRPLVRLSLTVVAEQNGRRETGNGGGGGRFGMDYFSDDLLQEYVDRATHEALINLEAQAAPAGVMPVVLGAGWPGVLLHEAVGHGLEGDFNRKETSVFTGQIGQRVASPGVTVIDDGTIPDRRGSLNVDDEGNPTQHNVLIEDGILKGYMQDSLNARLMKMPVTGNGRRQSYACLPMPRMTNTFMLGGDAEPDEILASVDDGIYAVNFGGGQVDITTGKFVFSSSEAYKVKNGKIQYPVKGVTIIGNGFDALNQVKMIGNDLKLDTGVGVCGKEGQSVPVGVGMPTIRIDGLTVGGTGS